MPVYCACVFEGGGAASSLSGQSDVAMLPEDADEVCCVRTDVDGSWTPSLPHFMHVLCGES
jgi:hypothetical protein